MSAARKCDICGTLFEPTTITDEGRTYKCYRKLMVKDINIEIGSIIDCHTFDICPACNKAIFDLLEERGLNTNDQSDL